MPYPGVLVAKAYSHTSKDLDLVLYPSGSPGRFTLGVERLISNGVYSTAEHSKLVADKGGVLFFDVGVDGRTEIKLVPQQD